MQKTTGLQRYASGLFRLLRSNRTFWVLFAVCGVEAVWIALSGAYSMAYDEYVHYGIMKLYMHQWSPFFASQPAGADAFGAVARDPSYLYHYLMSFPLRLFGHFFHAFAAQIIFLRLIDVAFFLGGVLLFRRALQTARLSRLTINLSLGFFLAIPVAPFMAAQVNYDDLLFLMTGLTMLLAVQVVRALRETGKIPLQRTMWLVLSALLASLVKYAYAPILLAVALFLTASIMRYIGWRPRKLWGEIQPQLSGLKNVRGAVVVIFLLLSLGLFAERYGTNIIRYHTPTPECDQVMSLEKCQSYEPYARNFAYHQGNYDLPTRKIAVYPFNNWIRGMVRSLFFTVGNKESGYPPGEPLLLAHAAGWIVFAGGIVLVVIRGRWLWRLSIANKLFITIVVVYVGILFMQNFVDFLHTHVAVAIQGRYLLPIMPLFLVLVAQASIGLFRKKPQAAAIILSLLIVLMLEGGGALPFALRFQDAWLWNAPAVRMVHNDVQNIVKPLIIGD